MQGFFVGLFPNLFYILATLFIIQFFLDRKQGYHFTDRSYAWVLFLFSAVSIILCITFPIRFNEDFIYDLRAIPYVIGGLYGGPVVSALLFVVTVIYRSFFGGAGIINTIILCGVYSTIIFIVGSRFKKMSLYQKMLFGMLIITLDPAFIFITIKNIFGISVSFSFLMITLFLQLFGTAMVIYIMEMIHRNRHLRSQLLRSEKMEAVSHLAASISHEIRNPMTTTKGFLQLLKGEETDRKKLEYFQYALDELQRAEHIIQEYLTFAKPSFQSMQTLDVKEQIERVAGVLSPLANMNSVEMKLNLIPCQMKGESSLFQQCFLNLFKNAIEAMPKGGKLSVNMSCTDKRVLIKVIDTGSGMTMEQVRRLGEPYFTTKDQKGTGLGMMVVYRSIEAMKGKIDVESQVGKGTCFFISFPACIEHQQ